MLTTSAQDGLLPGALVAQCPAALDLSHSPHPSLGEPTRVANLYLQCLLTTKRNRSSKKTKLANAAAPLAIAAGA